MTKCQTILSLQKSFAKTELPPLSELNYTLSYQFLLKETNFFQMQSKGHVSKLKI